MPAPSSRPDHLAELRAQAKQRIAGRVFAAADESDALLRRLGDEVARRCGCRAAYGPIKDPNRALQKVEGRLQGEWYELRDAVRMTIIAPDETALRRVRREVLARCVPGNGMGIIRDFEQLPRDSPCGYSGVNIAVRLENGWPGEIQANVPEVMYGQLGKAVFVGTLGACEHGRISRLKGVEGGLGHVLYEIYRAAPGSSGGQAAARLSTRYFDCLRSTIGHRAQQALAADIAAFKRQHPGAFAKA